MEAPNLDADVSSTVMASDNVDPDVEELQLAREEIFGYLNLILNNPPATLSKTNQLIGLVKKVIDDANNLHIMDYDSTHGLGAFESSLKKRKSFLSPKKKNERSKRSGGLKIDLNVPASEYELFQFQALDKRGRPCSNHASFTVPEVQHSTIVPLTQGCRLMQYHPSFPTISDIGSFSTDVPPLEHASLVDNFPVGDLSGNHSMKREGPCSTIQICPQEGCRSSILTRKCLYGRKKIPTRSSLSLSNLVDVAYQSLPEALQDHSSWQVAKGEL